MPRGGYDMTNFTLPEEKHNRFKRSTDIRGTFAIRPTTWGGSQAGPTVKPPYTGDLLSVATSSNDSIPLSTQATETAQAPQPATATTAAQNVQDPTAS